MAVHDGLWNHNLHYHQVILDAIPESAERGLDVGCGEGVLTRELRQRIPRVAGIDLDTPSLRLARRQDPEQAIEYLHGDFLSYRFEPASFDVIVSVAALHHMDTVAAIERMRRLLRPGGTLAVVGLARNRYPADLPVQIAGLALHRLYAARWTYQEHSAPKVDWPPQTYPDMRRLTRAALPGSRFRRHVLWRYSLIWTKPS